MDPDTLDRVAANMPVPQQQLNDDAAKAATDARVAAIEQQKADAEAAARAKDLANAARYGK
ncbi:MAG TPA: hypothetical protein VF272_03600 [Candidatus Saccharimonadia bacterium]